MVRNRLKVVPVAVGLTALGVVAAAGFAAGWAARSGADRPAPPSAVVPPVSPVPASAGTIVVTRGSDCLTFDPDGKRPRGEIPYPTGSFERPVLSPDGTRVALVLCREDPLQERIIPMSWKYHVMVFPVAGGGGAKACDLTGRHAEARWLPDGSALVVGRLPEDAEKPEYVRYDPDAGTTRRLALPDGSRLADVARDGSFLVGHEDRPGRGVLGLARAGEGAVRPLTELVGYAGTVVARLSPDGTKVLYADADPGRIDAHKWRQSERPYVLDVATGRRAALAEFPETGRVVGLAWAPDGRRVAYTWRRFRADQLAREPRDAVDFLHPVESSLVVADADGRNATTLATEAADQWSAGEKWEFGELDWR